MPDAIIERLARALFDAQDARAGQPSYEIDVRWQVAKQFYVDDVRAILIAMREPTEAMVLAGVTAPNYLEDQSSRRGCGNIFKAMIDAALAEEG